MRKSKIIGFVIGGAAMFCAMEVMAFSPTDISGLELWLDAADSSTITTTSVGRVSQWSDKSGKDKHATQATDNIRPLFVPSVTNGLPGIRFDSQYLNTSCLPATGANPRTLVAVLANVGQKNSNYEHVLHYGAGTSDQAYGICTRVGGSYVWGNHYWGSGFNTGVSSVSGGGWIVIADYHDGVDYFHINGQPPKTNSKVLNSSSSVGVRIGAHVSQGENGKFDALEVMAFSESLSVEERRNVEGYIAHKWGISRILPLDHTYKVYAPGGIPQIANAASSDISLTTATINGGLVSTGSAETAVMAYWGETDGGNDADAWANTNQLGVATQEPQNFSANISGLKAGTKYYYTFAATNDFGLVFAPSSSSFTTLPGDPLGANGGATDVLNTSATLHGTITYEGAPPTKLYAFWATNDCGAIASEWLANGGGTAEAADAVEGVEASAMATGLTPNTVYYYNFMASNAYGMAWGTLSSAPSFRTLGQPNLSGVNSSLITDISSRLSLTLDNGTYANVYFSWGLSSDDLANTNSLGTVPMGDYSVDLTGLDSATEHFWRASAVNDYGEYHSEVFSFTTLTNISEWTSVISGSWTDPATWGEEIAPREGAKVTIAAGHIVTLTEATPQLSSATVNLNGTLSFNGWETVLKADDVSVYGTVTHSENTATATNSLGIWVPNARVNIECANLTVATSGKIDGKSKGYAAGRNPRKEGYGPGRGSGGSTSAGHGGLGYGANATYGKKYDDFTAPTQPGSGGGWTSDRANLNGRGGGVVRIAATGVVTIDGQITTEAEQNSYQASGGSGGSVYITCSYLAGNGGVINANGSPKSGEGGATGGGGCIAVIYDSAMQAQQPLPGIVFSTSGGVAPNLTHTYTSYGDVGTLYFPDSQFLKRQTGTVRHSGVWKAPGLESWSCSSLIMSNSWMRFDYDGFALNVTNDLVVAGGKQTYNRLDVSNAVVNCGGKILMDYAKMNVWSGKSVSSVTSDGSATMLNYSQMKMYVGIPSDSVEGYGVLFSAGGDMTVSGNSYIHPYSHPTNGGYVKFEMNNLSVDATSAFDARGLGYYGGRPKTIKEFILPADRYEGWGPGRGYSTTISAGHGGTGWAHNGVYGETYGSVSAPVEPGSGGGYSDSRGWGSNGGGVIRIASDGVVTINGSLMADANGTGYHATGGAGGSVYVTCSRIEGTGKITATGSAKSGEGGFSGGGGRISVIYDVAAQGAAPLPELVFSAAGGDYTAGGTLKTYTRSGDYYGDVGTLYFPDVQFLSRNLGAYKHSGSWEAPGLSTWAPGSLVISNGWLRIPAGQAVFDVNSIRVCGTDSNIHRLDFLDSDVSTAGDIYLEDAGLFLLSYAENGSSIDCGGDFTMTNNAVFKIDAGAASVTETLDYCGAKADVAGDMSLSGGSWIISTSNKTNGYSAFLTVGNLGIIDSASGFDAWNRGFAGAYNTATPGYGPGAGYKFMGGGHGGLGSRASAPYGLTNDLERLPALSGSGGGCNNASYYGGGIGGGAIRIRVIDNALVNGQLLANSTSENVYGGSGSGGTIFMDCGKFSGGATAVMNANGANGNIWGGAAGAGGRIAIWYGVKDEDRARVADGDMKRVQITSTIPEYLGGATVAGGLDGGGGKLLTTGAGAGTIVFLTVLPPQETTILIR